MNNINSIPFYDKEQTFFEFTNFAPAPFTISEIPQKLSLVPHLIGSWKTSEHLFQAAKFTDKNIIEEIRQAPDTGFRQPGGVFWLANSSDGKYKRQIRKDWHSVKVDVMSWVVKQKFIQNSQLKDKLLKTGNAYLVEDSGKKDDFWGNGKKGNGVNYPLKENEGKNWLGVILMEVRKEFQEEENKKNGGSVPNKPQTPTGNDNEEVKFLQHVLYHLAKSDENHLDNKYINFPNDILDSYKSSKFSELEDYRIEMIKEILKKVDPKKVNELKKQILAEFEKNTLISKSKERELKEILKTEKENEDKSPNSDAPVKDSNRPTNNEDKSDDKSNKPVNNNNSNNNKNGNSPNQEPIISSPIDTKKITNSATVAKAHQQAKSQIIKLFQDNGVKPGDLDKNLWKNHESWEKYLLTLTTYQEIAQFAEKLQRAIGEKKKINNNLQPTKSNWGRFRPWIIGGVLVAVGVFFLFLIKKRIKKKKVRSKI